MSDFRSFSIGPGFDYGAKFAALDGGCGFVFGSDGPVHFYIGANATLGAFKGGSIDGDFGIWKGGTGEKVGGYAYTVRLDLPMPKGMKNLPKAMIRTGKKTEMGHWGFSVTVFFSTGVNVDVEAESRGDDQNLNLSDISLDFETPEWLGAVFSFGRLTETGGFAAGIGLGHTGLLEVVGQ